MADRHRIGAVHALLGSIGPTQSAFEHGWPDADVAHLLDGSLYLDRSRGTADEDEIARRIDALIRHSAQTGATAILFTGSFFGAAVRAASGSVDVPVLASFDGLVEAALSLECPLQVLSTAADSTTLLVAELEQTAAARGQAIDVTGAVVPGALDALIGHDGATHDQLVLDAIRSHGADRAVILAQFTMERVITAASAATSSPVLGPATTAVARLRSLLR